MKKIIALFILFSISSTFVLADGYKIKVTIDGLKDTSIYLGYHFGDKKYVTDTTRLNSKGVGIFEGNKKLDGGIYLIVLPSKTYFEIIIDKDQNFSIEADTAVFSNNYLRNIKISGSEENSQFYAYQIFMSDESKKAQDIRKLMNKEKNNADSTKILKEETDNIDKEVKDYWAKIIEKNPDGLLSAVLKALTEIDVPEAPKDENGNITDSTFRYRYYKQHYFDYIDFSDNRLLRTPVYNSKLSYFFSRVVLQHPDSIIAEAHRILEAARADSLVFQYTLQYLFNKYNSSNIMGFDEVFVDIAENYYLAGDATWADSAFLAKVAERLIKLKPNLLGQKAPNMKLPSPDGRYYNLYDIDAKAILVYFWDPDCGHCKKVIPKVHEYYEQVWDQGVEVFAVYTQIEKEKWEKFIDDNGLGDWINVYDPYGTSNFRINYDIYSTPVVYILDKDKKIIAKRIDLDTVKKILEEEMGIKPKTEEIKKDSTESDN
ncbi:MAG: redoxin domain-containing protein [Chlorobi bacterium]|nr:redoxin domain-containing protein [Chlorobiota bacterium]